MDNESEKLSHGSDDAKGGRIVISLFTFFSEFTAHSCQRMTNDEETPNTEAGGEMVLAKPPDVVYIFKLSQRSRIAGGN